MTIFPTCWHQRRIKKADERLSDIKGCSRILINILAGRSIITPEEIKSFLNPGIKQLHDPVLLPGIEKGVKRLLRAIGDRENILIFGDYDADGIISTALMYNFLKKLELDVEIYIPDRFVEGYDLGLDFYKQISAEGKYELLICVDCGTNSSEVMEYSSGKNGPNVIVCDHHNQSTLHDDSREDYIIINPRVEDSKYPFKHLSGAGVTFKFIMAVLRSLDNKFKSKFEKDYLTSLLDLVAVSTISDLMPLVDENRVIVKKGINMIKRTKNRGLKEMMDTVLKDKELVDEYDVGFIIAPRLNAAGRIKNARIGFDLLSSKAGSKASILNDLNSFNEKRQDTQKKIFDEIIENNDFDKVIKEKKIFIDRSKNWNEGVLGIVASDIVKKFNIPAILFKEVKGELKGSGRSTDKFDLYGHLISMAGLFDRFGGHRSACGIRMKAVNFENFKNKMLDTALKEIKDEDIEKKYYYDIEISFNDVDRNIMKELELLRPFGKGNPEPNFITRDCTISDFYYLSGKKHVKLKLVNSGKSLNAVMFRITKAAREKIMIGNKISLLYKIRKDNWNALETVQLVIIDLF
jgi:single-stranded-DNA-specific exonuclease